jgi:hypothetical protein
MDTAKANSISLHWADDEGPDHSDGEHYDSLKDLNRRLSGAEPKVGRTTKARFPDGEEVQFSADGDQWIIDELSSHRYATLSEAIDHFQEMKN